MSEERESFMEAAFAGAMAQHRTCADQLAHCRAALVEIKRLCDSRVAESFAGECLEVLRRYAHPTGDKHG